MSLKMIKLDLQSEQDSRGLPLVTVAMPIKNQEWCLKNILESLLNQTYPKSRIETIFVDDCSTDATCSILQDWIFLHKSDYHQTVVLHTKNVKGSIPEARNLCLLNATGQIIVFWDSDVLPPPEGLQMLVSVITASNSNVGLVGFHCDIEAPNLLDKIIRSREPSRSSEVRFVGMGFTAIKKEIIGRVGPFNPLFKRGEDVDYCVRAYKLGFSSVYSTIVRCVHLKKKEENTKYRSSYGRLLAYCFLEEPKQVAIFASHKYNFLVWKVIYYLFLPFVIIMVFVFPGLSTLVISLSYLLVLLAHSFLSTKKALYGILSAAVFILPGIAMSYGLIIYSFQKGFKELHTRFAKKKLET